LCNAGQTKPGAMALFIAEAGYGVNAISRKGLACGRR
jgi:hypothetical protein